MQARIRPADRLSKEQRAAMQAYARAEFVKQAQDNVRRLFKLMCLSLHEEFGFGKDRCTRLIGRINALAAEHERDEVYWQHVDSVMRGLGVDFIAENYEEVDR